MGSIGQNRPDPSVYHSNCGPCTLSRWQVYSDARLRKVRYDYESEDSLVEEADFRTGGSGTYGFRTCIYVIAYSVRSNWGGGQTSYLSVDPYDRSLRATLHLWRRALWGSGNSWYTNVPNIFLTECKLSTYTYSTRAIIHQNKAT